MLRFRTISLQRHNLGKPKHQPDEQTRHEESAATARRCARFRESSGGCGGNGWPGGDKQHRARKRNTKPSRQIPFSRGCRDHGEDWQSRLPQRSATKQIFGNWLGRIVERYLSVRFGMNELMHEGVV